MEYYNVTVIIPSLNPDEKLMNLINELQDNGFDDIVVIDDGSDAEHKKYFPNKERYPLCTVLTHRRNRGKGAALRTGFEFFLENRKGKLGVVTIDGDGQHLTNDIKGCVDEMFTSNKVVLGCRDFSSKNVPFRSRFGNRATGLVFRLFCGLKISDTQTGLRAIPARYLEQFVKIKGNHYEFETNMLLEMKKQSIEFVERTIDTVYIDGNQTSHFRPIVDSIRIYKLILSFLFSSLFSMFVELVLFYLALKFVFTGDHHEFTGKYDELLATFIARGISSVINFTLNRNKVFHGEGNITKSLFRYILLVIPLAITSALSVKGLSMLVGSDGDMVRTLLKMVVDTTLFFVSFRIQQNWVFATDNTSKKKKEDN